MFACSALFSSLSARSSAGAKPTSTRSAADLQLDYLQTTSPKTTTLETTPATTLYHRRYPDWRLHRNCWIEAGAWQASESGDMDGYNAYEGIDGEETGPKVTIREVSRN